jgi:NAD(P)-dependent dehydrogenase (short-subunit alcohol dehydrogenase family)
MNGTLTGAFQDRIAVVTGGASGIGQGIVRGFAEHGARVVIADMDRERAESVSREISPHGENVIVAEVDICDPSQVLSVVNSVLEKWMRIDILVNCAGWNEFKRPEDYTVEYWQKVRAVNLDGTWYFSQAVAVPMRKQRYGKIVNIGSSAGILANPNQAPYCVAKQGVIGITRAMAVDLGPYQINVNCICPTTVETPLGMKSTTPAFRARMTEQIPLRRLGQVADMVNAVLYLASPNADFISGVVLPVDGGLTCCRRSQHWEE